MTGKTISHYEISRQLGCGGMGIVYQAEDTKLKRTVALKFLPPELTRDREANERFIREARAAAKLNHINTCTLYEIDEINGQLLIAMEYVAGQNLKEKYGSGRLPIDESLRIITQIIQGLNHAHQQGVIHRDIKPANILITRDGIVKIVDFGIAKLKGHTQLTQNGKMLGTIDYISPEQAGGDIIDQRADIWSTGVLLYQMLTGQLPFKGDCDQVIIYSILHEKYKPITSISPEIPKELEKIVDRALQKDLDLRYQQIHHMGNDIIKFRENYKTQGPVKEIKDSRLRSGIIKINKAGISIALIMILLVIFFIIKPFILKKNTIENPIPIAVICFENQTGDDAYNYLRDAIPNLLITSLEQSPYLRVTTWERMHDLLKQQGKKDVQVIDKDTGFELCQLDGTNIIVLGSYTKAGDIFATDIKVLDVSTKRIIKSASCQGEGVASILKYQIGDLSEEISRGIGLSEEIIKSAQINMADATTSSMEAYRKFLAGRENVDKSYWEDALPPLKKAVELDSTFALAYFYLAQAYWALYNDNECIKASAKAKIYSSNVTEKEKLYIEESMALNVEHDYKKSYEILIQMVKKYPREKRIYLKLGNYYLLRNRFTEAVNELSRALELDPNFGPAYYCLSRTYVDMGNQDRAIQLLNEYAAVSFVEASPFDALGDLYFHIGKLDAAIVNYEKVLQVKPDFYAAYLKIAYSQALKEEYGQAVIWIDNYIDHAQSAGPAGEGRWWQAFYRFWLGQFNLSVKNLHDLITEAEKIKSPHGKAIIEFLMGWITYEHQEYEISRRYFTSSFDYIINGYPAVYLSYYKFCTGLIDIKQGEIDSVKFKLPEIQSFLTETVERDLYWNAYLTTAYQLLQAEALLAEDSVEKAITFAEESYPKEIPETPSMQLLFYNVPAQQDVLARIFLQESDLEKAISEYKRLITFDPKSKDRRLISPVYHYKLAKLYEKKGQLVEAAEQYKKFLEIWQNADADLPELRDAQNKLKQLTKKNQLIR
jgi:serine/threonine protein kinase/Tfp pilus assembly protein PilF